MIKTSKLFLVRHAPVEKRKGFIPKNNPNALINSKHIKYLASQIPDNSFCYISPLKRTVQTAEALSKYINFKEIKIEKNLVEQNFGDWAGRKISEVWEVLKQNENQHNFSFMCPEFSPPNGDSFLDQCKRTFKFINKLNFHDQKVIVVVTHSGTIRAILSHLLGIDPDISIGIEISYLSISLFEVLPKDDFKNRGGKYRLLGINK